VSLKFQKIIERAMYIRGQYEAKEKQQFGSAWTSEEVALGFVGDVGDLEISFSRTMDELEEYLSSNS
jgi:hypothetical protein